MAARHRDSGNLVTNLKESFRENYWELTVLADMYCNTQPPHTEEGELIILRPRVNLEGQSFRVRLSKEQLDEAFDQLSALRDCERPAALQEFLRPENVLEPVERVRKATEEMSVSRLSQTSSHNAHGIGTTTTFRTLYELSPGNDELCTSGASAQSSANAGSAASRLLASHCQRWFCI